MNTSFLTYVAQDIINKFGTNLSRVAVVFPNKRASLFMNEQLARLVDKPIWSPSYITISDLFRKHSPLSVADPIKLICDLHRVFTSITGIDETLDHFYGWGQLLLADFDDIDKNMADSDKVFANLRDIHEMDDIDYLTEEQKALLAKFFSNFSEEQNSILKERFLKLWNHFNDIYTVYNQQLSEQGLAYEGALYRQVADNEDIQFNYDVYVFVGFNVLQKVEQKLFKRLKDAGKALFYWDFDRYYMTGHNESGHYIKQYLELFPNELDNHNEAIYDNLSKKKDITFTTAPTENVQARYVSQWLRENGRTEAGRSTAIVLCDESLLQAVVHCIPPEVKKVNITTGYPLAQSPFASLVNMLISVQTENIVRQSGKYRLRSVLKLLRHPYMKFVSPRFQEIIDDLLENKQFYPSRKYLSADEGLSLLFKDIHVADEPETLSVSSWLLEVFKHIGKESRQTTDPFFQESLFRMYTLINRLHELMRKGDLQTDMPTFQRLLTQLISSTSIPFHGEPAEGIQIMGVLETRNLDFDHVLVLSCNEGNMPKGVNDASFIPYSIRKAFNLTTIDNKVAIYAYYFHRLLQRATDINLVYNNATEDGHTGEMSRFMLQLMVESPHNIKLQTLQTGQVTQASKPKQIEKTEAVMDKMLGMNYLSPTAINRYIRCQLAFYYNVVAGIKEPDDPENDEIDNRIFGNIFHLSAELIYRHLKASYGNTVTAGALDGILKHPTMLDDIVDRAFRKELFKAEDQRFRPEYNGLMLINRRVIISYLKQLLEIDKRLTPFEIIDVEHKVFTQINVTLEDGRDITFGIGGYIDRLDKVKDPDGNERIRVLDYKTGRIPSQQVYSIDDVFSGVNTSKKHSDYYLQTMLYSAIVRTDKKDNPANQAVSPALLFIQHAAADDYDPTLEIGRAKINDIRDLYDDFMQGLQGVVNEIFTASLPFKPTEDQTTCATCPYQKLCNV
ncbi:MAG: PD-(D/E)XK nuclease family protein [Prevotella sp.]|nr:PD-(D/E)XK nuclease family protein [Prevotella sp.]